MTKYINKSKLLGKIGTENYRVSDCPVHLPKENVKFFMTMQDAGNKDPFSSDKWGNQITPGWKKPFHESIVSAISNGIKNALNESNGLVSEEECLRANLVCLYDHCEQDNFFIIKNPSVEDIKKIGTFHDRYYWHKKDTDDKKDRLVSEMIQWEFYNIKLDGLTSIEYDDENINLCSFDLKNDEELYKFVYKVYTDKDEPLKLYSFKPDTSKEAKIKYVLNMIDQNILNKRDHYGFGIGIRLSFIEDFFDEYKDLLERYNKGEKDLVKSLKEKQQILSSYNSFKSYMKDHVKKSVCAGDSSRAILLLNLKTEQFFDQAQETKIHFIKTFQEYKDEMYKLLTKDKVNESFNFLNESNHEKEINNDSKECGEKWIEINQNNKLYKLVDQTTENNNSKITVHYIAKVKNASNYIVCLYGGLNGSGQWINYLKDLVKILSKLLTFCKYAVIPKIDTDVLDDVWRAWISIEPKNVNESFDFNSVLNEGWWGHKPEQSDTYLDFSHELGQPVIDVLLKNLKDSVEDYKKYYNDHLYAWLGLFLDMLKVKTFQESWYYSKHPKNEYKTVIDVFEIADEGFELLLNEKENKLGWKDFNDYKKHIGKMYDEFKLLRQYYNMDEKDPKDADKLIREAFDFNSNNTLNEGSWGYDPNDGDGPLDMRFDINLSIFEKIYDRCKKDVDYAKKEHYAQWAWDVVGQIEYFFDRATSLDNLADEPNKKFKKYDFWWKLKSRKKKDILELYKEALDVCEKDKHWINEWKEPKRMIASLKRRHKFLDKMLKIQEQKDNYEKRIREKQTKNNKQEILIQDDIVTEGFMFEGECCGECGGVGGSYNTPMNTIGVGNVVPAQGAAISGAQQASDMFNGSGDLTIPKSQKKSNKKKSKNSEITYFPLATKKGI